MATFGMDPQAQRQGSVAMAILAGIGVAIAGSLLWGLIAYFTKYQFSLMALLMGFAVGTVVVRVAGGIRSPGLAAACAVVAVLGCALGSLVAEILVLLGHGIPASLITAHLDLVLRAYPSSVGALGFAFWGLGAFYGYRIAMGAPVWRRRTAPPGRPQADGQQYGVWPRGGSTGSADPAASQPLFFPPPEFPATGTEPAAGTDPVAGTDPAGPPPSAPAG